MSIDKITEFKSSILDEVYCHQGFLTSISKVLDSCDEVKRGQLTPLVTEQQRRINKSLGLIYSFFRTSASLDELENQIKQIVGEDLDNSFVMNDSNDFESSFDGLVNVSDNVDVVQSEVQLNEENSLNQQDSPSVENSSSDVVLTEGDSMSVESVGTDAVAPTVVTNDDQSVVQNDNGTNDFVLSPIEEGVAVDSSNSSSDETVVVENQVAPAPVVEVAAGVDATQNVVEEVAQESVNVVSNAIDATPKKYIRGGRGQVRAILVTSGQSSKLSASRESQKALLSSGDKVQSDLAPGETVVSVDTQVDSINVQAQVQNLMNQASQAYAAGNAEEAQMYMNQVSELNKTLQPTQTSQPTQTDGGVALVKKGI